MQDRPRTRSAGSPVAGVVQKGDVASRQVKEWLGRAGSSLAGRRREPWEDLDVFFAPSGVVNMPWEVGVARFQRQCDAMREYLPLKARQDRRAARPPSESGRATRSPGSSRAGDSRGGNNDGGDSRDGGDVSREGDVGDSWDRRSTRAVKRELRELFRDDLDGPDR